MKYRILKIIDISGLAFLDPVVRLAYGEEPRIQVRAIGRMIVAPIIAFALFIGLWAELAPRHRTKAGEVPTPRVVMNAAGKVWQFHVREGAKAEGYEATGGARLRETEEAKTRLLELDGQVAAVDARVEEEKLRRAAEVEEEIAPLQLAYEEKLATYRADEERRKKEWLARAETVPATASEQKLGLLVDWADHLERTEIERNELGELKAEINALRSQPSPELAAALRAQSAIAEERQFLSKQIEMLTRQNREVRIADARSRIDALSEEYAAASGVTSLQSLANNIVRSQERIDKVGQSSYAKPYTLPMQTLRSLLCVFVGFLIGTVIAVPMGVLCGLSPTAMAAMTPFIALFKPVSPIVWLPIALIIVGGFIPDPDKHWLISGMAELPLIGWMKINPAFLASAITVALCSLWATLANTALGVASIDKDHLNVARMLQLGFRTRLMKIVLPSALPLIFAGLRISLGVGWMVLIAAELLSSSEGIGKYVWDMFNNGASESFAQMFVVVFVVGFIGLLLDRIMIVFQRLVSFDGAPASI